MGKVKGFLEWTRREPPKRPKVERVGDWREFYLERGAEESRRQGGRCMDCGVPFCQQGCPLGNLIPDWNDLIYREQWQQALVALHATNNFPEFTGRLCPAPCESACVLAINDQAVTIEHIEREIIERGFAEGWVVPQPPAQRTGKRVAVIGSGPAGLAAAAQLNRAGHSVTVFERDDRVGGLLRYGIPDFKMEKWVIDRRVAQMEAEGVEFRVGVGVGETLGWGDVYAKYDALVVALGAQEPRELPVPGRELPGVHLAMDYLTQQNRRVAGDAEAPAPIDARDKRVIILGGGDTGSDCLGTAHRQGAAHVTQIELLPAPPEERAKRNPWPQWPMIMRTSSSQEEGGERDFALMTKALTGRGKVERLEAVRVEMGAVNGGGPHLDAVPGSDMSIDADLVILAMGFVGPKAESLHEQLSVKLDGRGNVAVDRRYQTSVPRVWAAGDAKRGASLIVWAIAEGREAARCVDQALRGAESWLPTRGIDQPFGGR